MLPVEKVEDQFFPLAGLLGRFPRCCQRAAGDFRYDAFESKKILVLFLEREAPFGLHTSLNGGHGRLSANAGCAPAQSTAGWIDDVQPTLYVARRWNSWKPEGDVASSSKGASSVPTALVPGARRSGSKPAISPLPLNPSDSSAEFLGDSNIRTPPFSRSPSRSTWKSISAARMSPIGRPPSAGLRSTSRGCISAKSRWPAVGATTKLCCQRWE